MTAYVFFKKDMHKPFVDPDLSIDDLCIYDYTLVASVEHADADVALQSCNHIDKDWRENDNVTYMVRETEAKHIRSDGCRSMSIGDIVIVGDTMYLCESLGWAERPLTPEWRKCFREPVSPYFEGVQINALTKVLMDYAWFLYITPANKGLNVYVTAEAGKAPMCPSDEMMDGIIRDVTGTDEVLDLIRVGKETPKS